MPYLKPKDPIVEGDGDPRHGTPHGYKAHGCRCDRCTAANARSQRAYRAGKGTGYPRRGSGLAADGSSRPTCRAHGCASLALPGGEWCGPCQAKVGVIGEAVTERAANSAARHQRTADSARATRPDLGWMDRAACHDETLTQKERWDLFYPTGSDDHLHRPGATSPAALIVEQAKAVCHTCPVIDQCLTYALQHEPEFGVWGGKSARERRQMKRRAANTARLTQAGQQSLLDETA